MVEEQQAKKVVGLKVAAKNMVMYQSCGELGLYPATKPTVTMIYSTLCFN